MSNFIQKLLDSMKLDQDNDDFDEEDFETKAEPERPKQEPARPMRRFEAKAPNFEDEDDEEDDIPAPAVRRNPVKREEPQRSPKTTSGRTMVTMRNEVSAPSDICILHPKRFEDSQEICDMLKEGRVIFVNFESLGAEYGQRIMDFISGAVYALDANIHQISNFNFVIAPGKVEISGDYIDSLKEGAFEVPILLGNH